MKAYSRKKLEDKRVDWEMNCLNMFFAQNNEIVVLKSRGPPIISFVIGKRYDLYVFGDVEVPNQLGDERRSMGRRGSTSYDFLGSHRCEIGSRKFV